MAKYKTNKQTNQPQTRLIMVSLGSENVDEFTFLKFFPISMDDFYNF